MQRWQAAFFAALLVLATYVVIRAGSSRSLGTSAAAAASPTASITAPARDVPPPSRAFALDLDAGIELPLEVAGVDAGTGDALPNGSAAPVLDDGAPKSVTFGAVLVEYRGAEAASHGARSREEALALAKKLAEEAKTDFAAAVKAGDRGSSENIGAMPRGVLEPGPEYVLFNLGVGDVSEPVDSPRGFYIFKRID
jgi:hypothetical protein